MIRREIFSFRLDDVRRAMNVRNNGDYFAEKNSSPSLQLHTAYLLVADLYKSFLRAGGSDGK